MIPHSTQHLLCPRRRGDVTVLSGRRFQAVEKPQRRGKVTSLMESNSVASVQYDRWNEDNINMNVEPTQSPAMR